MAAPADYQYQLGFGNHFATEALPGCLPEACNTPQQCAKGLYAEQISGTAFTAPRARNQRTWVYRIRPTAVHKPFEPVADQGLFNTVFGTRPTTPNQLRWLPAELPKDSESIDFVQGIRTMAGAGDPALKTGLAVHLYLCNRSMVDKAFCNADGDMLIVPQEGELDIQTELGRLRVRPGEICVVQRLLRFAVAVAGPSRGYIAELFQGHFTIPDLGPIGANGLANPRDFKTPVAAYEDRDCAGGFEIVQKFINKLYRCVQCHSPFDVVAWHGNYAPYKYDLADYCVVNSVSYDHLDPSIFTVLTAQSADPGVAVCDFVIFPPRFMVQENTFRPPYYHRNMMSEFMGLIRGVYDAKEGATRTSGFFPGGSSLHSCGTAHGPDAATFEKASAEELAPKKIPKDSLAFMFESVYMLHVTEWAAANNLDEEYWQCWQGLKKHFKP